jgi:hypothetical protein
MIFPFDRAQARRVVGHDQQRADWRGEAVEKENRLRHFLFAPSDEAQHMAAVPSPRWRFSAITMESLTMSENR